MPEPASTSAFGAALRAQRLAAWQLGDRAGIAQCLEGLADVAVLEERAERAARLLGSASTVREGADRPLSPVERVSHEATVVAARERLPESVYAAAWADGRASTLERAVAYALGTLE